MTRRKYVCLGIAFAILISILWLFFTPDTKEVHFSERVKISLRDVGNQLLLENQDTVSLVLPVIEINELNYELSFERPLSITPNNIVSIVKESFHRAALPGQYLIEVIQCKDQEVAYSYSILNDIERDIIPCSNRVLPENCFTIKAQFIQGPPPMLNKQQVLLLLCILFVLFIGLAYWDRLYTRFRESVPNQHHTSNNTHTAIGIFKFYPEQNKLVKEAIEIGLSKKECELLAIFVSQPNQVVKRDELTKRVWEDNGVIVGRSLDTYISKLRKKLKDDTSIKITNVHGVGYKLEMNE
ncbi:winged helix-turn-helix domain-containing protein [uncultured Dokdonia sp.]|uniref:winged helix-turn-helix domain-containing protein n=1 Tax=uncultured Dokdonia sp. TaxID=575653 RepID=UPI0026357F6A|nr:winged helix-turn-helix domain-containing protein [uncultured Dokdonia sp.]